MSDWKLLKSETQSLTRAKALELAAKHAGMPRSPVEREIDPNRVKKLAAIIRSGLALPFNWATVDYEGQKVRMNGQHSSTAIMEVGSDAPANLTFHIDHYQATSRGGMVELFRQFDQRWSSRSSLDISGAYQGLTPGLEKCNRRLAKKGAEGVSWLLRTVEGSEAPFGDNTYDLFHDARFTDFFVWVDGIWNGRKELMHPQILAAMCKSYGVSQSGATKFWREVSFGPDFFTDDMAPGAVLIGELSKAIEDRDYRVKEFENPAFYYKKAAKAWNAYCSGQRIASLKVTKQKGWPEFLSHGEQEEAAA